MGGDQRSHRIEAHADLMVSLYEAQSGIYLHELRTALSSDMYALNIVDTSHKVRHGNLPWLKSIAADEEAHVRKAEKWSAYVSAYKDERERRISFEADAAMKPADVASAGHGLPRRQHRAGSPASGGRGKRMARPVRKWLMIRWSEQSA